MSPMESSRPWPPAPRPSGQSSLALDFQVAQQRLVGERDLVFNEQAATGTGELPEHRARVDETLRVADDRVRVLDRAVIAQAAQLVVRVEGAQVRRALRTAPAAPLDREPFHR